MTEMDMRDVVRQLRAENCAALDELLEFDSALNEFIAFMERLEVASQALRDAARSIVTSTSDAEQRIDAVREGADKLSAGMTQALGAFRLLRGATQAWEVVAVDEPQRPRNGGDS